MHIPAGAVYVLQRSGAPIINKGMVCYNGTYGYRNPFEHSFVAQYGIFSVFNNPVLVKLGVCRQIWSKFIKGHLNYRDSAWGFQKVDFYNRLQCNRMYPVDFE